MYCAKYNKIIHLQSVAEDIIGDYSGVYISKRFVRLAWSSWRGGYFGNHEDPCYNQARIDWLVNQSITCIDDHIRLGKVKRVDLPGANVKVARNLAPEQPRHSNQPIVVDLNVTKATHLVLKFEDGTKKTFRIRNDTIEHICD